MFGKIIQQKKARNKQGTFRQEASEGNPSLFNKRCYAFSVFKTVPKQDQAGKLRTSPLFYVAEQACLHQK